ncbi:MAG: PSD1 and planctomycete cytochrome C domain-containing protein [Acidobacteriota bacterium]|nr:PSD1 and planctomycete cytochrome C domain-containing protein [Acidobacteriota bacterium]
MTRPRFRGIGRWWAGLVVALVVVSVGPVRGTGSVGAGTQAPSPEALAHFESKIRPVLAERCYRCHGSDPDRVRGGLVLLDAAGMLAGGDSGAVIVPGSPDESLLIDAIRYEGSIRMPPDGRLSVDVVADFERWVQSGAFDPRVSDTPVVATRSGTGKVYDFGPGREHWAFRAMGRPEPPGVEDESWVRGPIDRFILARLEADGLAPVAPADRRQLLRRVTFDLTGLSPTPEDIEAFLADGMPNAYARMVDRLLASPRYGERWGRHWLDVARYADSNGLDENVAHPNAFRYRDWVIKAFNDNKPYSEFVQEQIAGDLMSDATTETDRFGRLTATGFLTLGAKVLAEQDVEKMLIDIVDEQVNAVGRAFLAEPVGCARCHDHKFDPIPTADYYALAGIMRSTNTMGGAGRRWVERPLADDATVEVYEAAQREVVAAGRRVDELVDAQNDILRRPRRQALADYLLATEEAYASWDEGIETQDPATEVIARVARRHGLEAAVLERWVRAFHRYREGPPVQGDAPNPSVVFEIWDAYAAVPAARYPEVTEGLRAMIASEKVLTAPLTRSVIRGPVPRSLEEVAWRYAALFAMIEIAWDEHLGRLGIKDADELESGDFRLPREQEELRRLVFDGRLCILCLDQKEEEARYSPQMLTELARRRAQVATLTEALPPEPPYAMAVEEGEIVDLPVHIRGSHLNLADRSQPRGFLRVTDHLVPPSPIPDGSSGRLELARWLIHPEHPLTARVMVNRVWHWHFGRGLVDTPSNFGTTGSSPSHPELLDWLARRFIDSGWSIKTLHRDILLSSTYRLGTAYNETNAAVDQGNRLHWRMNRRRLEVEAIRDTLLQLARSLDLTMGGRVEEYNPRGYVFSEGSTFGQFNLYAAPRRSVYMPVVRNAIYDIFAGFDFGNASDSVGARPSTVVPSQALLMMNSAFVEAQAGAFAARLLAESMTSTAARVERAFLEAYGRPATNLEIEDSLVFLDEMREVAPANQEEMFAWTRLSHVIVGASEFIYLD